MTQLLLSVENPEDELDLKAFLASHPGVKAVTQTSEVANSVEFADIYDSEGNFKELNLSIPNGSVTKEYMQWYVDKAKASIRAGNGLTIEELRASIENKRNQYFSVK